MFVRTVSSLLLGVLSVAALSADALESPRSGNVYLAGDAVVARFPEPIDARAKDWRVVDDRGRVLARGPVTSRGESSVDALEIGALGVGWYRVEVLDPDGAVLAWTTAAVLARLKTPPSEDSPIAVDSAAAWFARDDAKVQAELADLAALCGVRWVRDRLRWRELEPAPKALVSEETTYDTSARAHAKRGLRVLQVFHDSPAWAADAELDGRRAGGRFTRDLRHVYRFAREAAKRFRGQVQAWEPWNEANVGNFGGHSVDEMCSWQKAAWLGFKAGDPELTVGWNAYAGVPSELHTDGVLANETWPYFDTYNIHSYDWPDSYRDLWAPARRAACGKPIWVTEADRGIRYEGPRPWCELPREAEIRKAEYMAHAYAQSLFAGAGKHFHFILGHYTEDSNGVQFGLLRLDRTPRPAYVALAALGRLLAGARCLGRWSPPEQPHARIYAFEALPDAQERDVLVAWHEAPGDWNVRGAGETPWSLPEGIEPLEVFDYLGRSLGDEVPHRLVPAAVFVVLPRGGARQLPLQAPPSPAPARAGAASPVVLKVEIPRSFLQETEEGPWSHGFEYALPPGGELELPVVVYNFGKSTAVGEIRVEGIPEGARIEPRSWKVAVSPMQTARITASYESPAEPVGTDPASWVRFRGELGDAGRPALAFRIAARRSEEKGDR